MHRQPDARRRPRGLFLVYFAAVLAVSCLLAHFKLLWFDELMTLYVARRPSLTALWACLCDGPDPAPPLHLLAVRLSIGLLGETNLAIRLPAILGFLLMIVCLKSLASKDLSPSASWVAAILPLATYGFAYAYEARAYGLWMGLTALALLLWREATEGGPWSKAACLGLGITLAAGVSTHWYSVLLVVPLGLGELERTWRTRKVSPWVWVAFAAGFIPLLFYGPLLANGRQYSGNFWAKPTWTAIPLTYASLLRWPGAIGVVGLFGWMIVKSWGCRNQEIRSSKPPQVVPRHLVVAATVFILLPLAEVALAKIMHGGYTVRYALPSLVGMAWLVAFGVGHLESRGILKARSVAIVLLVGAVILNGQSVTRSRDLYGWTSPLPEIPEVLVDLPDDHLPLVVAEATRFLPMAHYRMDSRLGREIVYFPHEIPTEDTLWISMRKLRPLVDHQILDLDDFVVANPHFYFLETTLDHFRRGLEARGAQVIPRAKSAQSESLFEIFMNPSPSPDSDQ